MTKDQLLAYMLDVFESGVSHLRLHHPELGEMAAGLRFFGAEHRTEAIGFAEGRGGRLAIELAGLREIDFFVLEVIDFEESRGAFASGGREDRRVH